MDAPVEAEGRARRAPLFLRALNTAFGRTPVWILCGLMAGALALPVALPWARWFAGALDHRYAPGELLRALDGNFRFDQRAALGVLERQTSAAGAAAALLAMLAGVFSAGGWLQILLERTEGHSVLRFFFGGARYFWRFLRVLLISLVLLSLASWALQGMPWKKFVLEFALGLERGEPENFASERSAVWAGWIQDGLHAAAFGLVLLWGTYTRTRLAVRDSRSAVWAGLCTLGVLLRHPVRTGRPAVAIFLAALTGTLGLGLVSGAVEAGLGSGGALGSVLLLLGLSQLALLWRALCGGAQYAAAVEVSRELVPPAARPDPFAQRIGAPGGPQYPIGGDEFGV